MPESRTERIICLAGAVGLGLLIALIVPQWSERAHSGGADAEAPTVQTAHGGSAHPSAERSESGAFREQLAFPRTAHTLRLTAARGACWLQVESSGGRPLYAGTLPRGESLTFRGGEFRVRMGAGQNLAVLFDGAPLTDLPEGTATVAIESGDVSVLEVG